MANKQQFEHLMKYKKEQRKQDSKYVVKQFDKLQKPSQYKYNLKIYDGHGNSTFFMGVNAQQLDKIKQIMLD